jgi:hypothetical protein
LFLHLHLHLHLNLNDEIKKFLQSKKFVYLHQMKAESKRCSFVCSEIKSLFTKMWNVYFVSCVLCYRTNCCCCARYLRSFLHTEKPERSTSSWGGMNCFIVAHQTRVKEQTGNCQKFPTKL